jgi:hypothetical protein
MSAGKLHIVEQEMERNNIKVLGVAELWWNDQGRFTTDNGNLMVYSGEIGKESGRKRMGVGFLVDKITSKSILGYNPVNERVITLRLKGHPVNVTFIQVYAPTADSSDKAIEDFYQTVQEVVDQTPRKDIKILLGDWNAKIGKSGTKTPNIGTFGLGRRNERGDRLEEFCVTNDLVVGNTLFQHHPRRLWTWMSPGDGTRNQLDYILIDKRWKSSLQNVKTLPGADCGSDHQLLVAKMRLKLKAKKSEAPPTRYDVGNIPEQFTVDVRNRFQELLRSGEEEQTPNELWDDMREVVISAAKKHIPKKKRKKQPWITKTTLNLAEERRKAKAEGNRNEWSRLNSAVSKGVSEDKRNFIEKKCDELEAHKGESKKIFQIVKELTGKHTPRTDVINDEEGNTLTEIEDIKQRWAEYTAKLYETKDHQHTYNCGMAEEEPAPLRSEIEKALLGLNNGKSPGSDDIPAELWKASGEEGVDLLWRLCTKIWKTGEWPDDWCRAVFVPLPKKGNLKDCSNYRTISLISHASKIMLRIIINRIKIKLEEEISITQAGFREGRGTRDQIVNLRNVIEKCKDHKQPLYMCFIDYSKAFDCVSHNEMWEVLHRMGFPKHIIDLMSQLYSHQESAVRTNGGNTEWFSIGRGLRQGCILSPSLFNIYSEEIMREALEGFEGGVRFGGMMINNLRYADDTTLICASREELMMLLQRVKQASAKKGLLLNTKKTKIMVKDGARTNDDFFLDGQQIEEVDEFDYLGSLVNNRSDSTTEIRRRLAIARNTTQNMMNIWKSRGVSTELKLRFMRATVFSVATYGCESWAPTKKDSKRIDAFEMWCYRRLLRISWKEKRSNEWVLRKIGSELVLRNIIRERKLKYFGHIMRRENSIEKQIIQGAVKGKRGRGRPITSWTDQIKMSANGSMARATTLAQDRGRWRALVKATAVPMGTI